MDNSPAASGQEADRPNTSNRQYFSFSGDAGDYFGIWFVNNILSAMTLGIYSAWAKVRNTQYFYGNTEFGGGNFDFTASPWKILRGRIIAVLLFALYFYSDYSSSTTATIIFAVMVVSYFLFAPILTIWVMSFRLRHSEWRGISFRFRRDYGWGYRAYLPALVVLGLISFSLYAVTEHSLTLEEALGVEHYEPASEDDAEHETEEPIDTASEYENADSGFDDINADSGFEDVADSSFDDSATDDNGWQQTAEEDSAEDIPYINPTLFYIPGFFALLFVALIPWFDFLHCRFLFSNVYLGTARFSFHASLKQFYAVYAAWFIALALLVVSWVVAVKSDMGFTVFATLVVASMLFVPLSRAYLTSRRYCLMLSHTLIDKQHRLQASIPFLHLAWLLFSNSIVVALTFGMMIPWAKVRTARFILPRIAVDVAGSLDDFVAHQEQEVSALAEEVGDMFDLDIML